MTKVPHKRLVVSQVIALCSALVFVVLMLLKFGLLGRIENMAYDLRMRLRGPVKGREDIVFCDIDENTLEDLAVFPIPRNYYTRAFRLLKDAKLVFLDIFFFEPSPARIDPVAGQRLMAAVQSLGQQQASPEDVARMLQEMLTTPDKEMMEVAREAGNMIFPIILNEEESFEGVGALTRAKTGRAALAERVHQLLLKHPDLHDRWDEGPLQTRRRIANLLEIEADAIDPLLAHLVNKQKSRALRSLVEMQLDPGSDKFFSLIGDRDFDQPWIKSNSQLTEARLHRFCDEMMAILMAEQIRELYLDPVENAEQLPMSEIARRGLEAELEAGTELELALRKELGSLKSIPLTQGKAVADFRVHDQSGKNVLAEFDASTAEVSSVARSAEPEVAECKFVFADNDALQRADFSFWGEPAQNLRSATLVAGAKRRPNRLTVYVAETALDAANDKWRRVAGPLDVVGRETTVHFEVGKAAAIRFSLAEPELLQDLLTTYDMKLPLLGACEASQSIAFAQVDPDPDGVVRTYPLLIRLEKELYPAGKQDLIYPAAGLAMACECLGVDVSTIRYRPGRPGYLELPGVRGAGKGDVLRIPVDQRGRLRVNWCGRWKESFRHVRFSTLVAQNPDGTPTQGALDLAESLKDKIVLIGLTASGTVDLNPMPLEPRYPMVGSHANVVNTILTQKFIHMLPEYWDVVLVVACAVMLALGTGLLGWAWALAFAVGFTALNFGVALFLFTGSRLVINVTYSMGAAYATFALVLLYRYVAEAGVSRFIKTAFSHYLSPDVVDQLMKDPDRLSLGGEEREVTVFFSDVAGFSTISEGMTASELIALLNEYLSVMTDIVLARGGLLDKYEGDAIIAIFGAPNDMPDHAIRTCHAAIENQQALTAMRVDLKARGLPELKARIGINTGPVVVGNVGSGQRFDYSGIGDNMNLGARLEGVNKVYGTYVMISETTYAQAKEAIEARELDTVRVVGKDEPIVIYEVLTKKGELDDQKRRVTEIYAKGLAHYRQREWEEARGQFQEALALDPDDGPSKALDERCVRYAESPPPEPWDSVHNLTEK